MRSKATIKNKKQLKTSDNEGDVSPPEWDAHFFEALEKMYLKYLHEHGPSEGYNRVEKDILLFIRIMIDQSGIGAADPRLKYFERIKERISIAVEFKLRMLELNSPKARASKQKPALTQAQKALILVYNKETVTRSTAKSFAEAKSGDNLYNLFSKYSSRANRIGRETTKEKRKNKAELIKSVIEHLTGTAKAQAESELRILQSHLE